MDQHTVRSYDMRVDVRCLIPVTSLEALQRVIPDGGPEVSGSKCRGGVDIQHRSRRQAHRRCEFCVGNDLRVIRKT